nr:hypothetical protein [Pengzhenrongella sicca]
MSATDVSSSCLMPGCQGRPRFCEPSGADPTTRLFVIRKPYAWVFWVLAAVSAPLGVVPWSSALSVQRSKTAVARPNRKSTSPSM